MTTITNFIANASSNNKFADIMNIIAENYIYQATEFSNGFDDPLINAAGTNEGACKIFAFAQLHNLSVTQTLYLFGEHYRSVLTDPNGNEHQNIRNFIQSGWEGIKFSGVALIAK